MKKYNENFRNRVLWLLYSIFNNEIIKKQEFDVEMHDNKDNTDGTLLNCNVNSKYDYFIDDMLID